ncbi:hypothetical protein BJY24_001750 [Nocardia transvalensis]|uniref:Uncharacterized protein n=1 Tax=Nocardia transvalensis TaxID=37333 RepID=A0A7W9PBW7_9NOCA|nr:hypothetical protein [Nocardia transvalensis]MBB5912883.1 hypothetical protein [Nocardia transvalensis]
MDLPGFQIYYHVRISVAAISTPRSLRFDLVDGIFDSFRGRPVFLSNSSDIRSLGVGLEQPAGLVVVDVVRIGVVEYHLHRDDGGQVGDGFVEIDGGEGVDDADAPLPVKQ